MHITHADSEAVTRAVAEAELKTSGEIVTVVAQESGTPSPDLAPEAAPVTMAVWPERSKGVVMPDEPF